MAFQILDSNKEPIKLSKLDLIACELWGIEVDRKWYAQPTEERYAMNWFDKIGWLISEGVGNNWLELKVRIMAPFFEKGYTKEQMTTIPEFASIGGHIKLIEVWERMGYTPKRIED